MTSEYGSQDDDHEYSEDNEQAKSGGMRTRAYIPSASDAYQGKSRFQQQSKTMDLQQLAERQMK